MQGTAILKTAVNLHEMMVDFIGFLGRLVFFFWGGEQRMYKCKGKYLDEYYMPPGKKTPNLYFSSSTPPPFLVSEDVEY